MVPSYRAYESGSESLSNLPGVSKVAEWRANSQLADLAKLPQETKYIATGPRKLHTLLGKFCVAIKKFRV